MQNELTIEEWETEFGRQVREIRLRQNLDQRTLALRAGVALNAVKRLESGKGATIKSMIGVLRTLKRADWLTTLSPPVSVSPLQLLKTRKPRERASKSKGGMHA